jgi:hypothetical protein
VDKLIHRARERVHSHPEKYGTAYCRLQDKNMGKSHCFKIEYVLLSSFSSYFKRGFEQETRKLGEIPMAFRK